MRIACLFVASWTATITVASADANALEFWAQGEGEGELLIFDDLEKSEGEADEPIFYCPIAAMDIAWPHTDIYVSPGTSSIVVDLITTFQIRYIGNGNCARTTVSGGYTLSGSFFDFDDIGDRRYIRTYLTPGEYTLDVSLTQTPWGPSLSDSETFRIVDDLSGLDISVLPNPAGGIDFGDVAMGRFADQSFTVTNVGETILTGGAYMYYATHFKIIDTDEFELAPGQSEIVTVRFAPQELGNLERSFLFWGDPDGRLQIDLRGSGLEAEESAGCGWSDHGPSRGDLILFAHLVMALAVNGLLRRSHIR